jgi:predicted transcriptional regulator
LYFFNNNNEVLEIAKALNISTSVANRVIDNYFKNKGLIVESKINEK